jgi:hypothetical protein
LNTPRNKFSLKVFADYHQFYIWDPKGSGRQAPVDWTEEDVSNRLKVAPGVVVISPVRNMEVPVEVTVWENEPQIHLGEWQHVAEAPLKTEGSIEVHECTGGALALFSVEPGDYTVRALFRGLDRLSEDGLEGEDSYDVQIWKGRCDGLRIIQKWEG